MEREVGPMLSPIVVAVDGSEEWLRKYPEVDVRADVVRCHPAHLLASLSARADLLIVARHGEPGRRGSSIQHAVLGHARGPVAIVPA
jgi:hypothetical protein